MKLSAETYLSFDGNCEEALAFYQRSLDATIVSKHTYGGSPMAESTPAGWDTKIMHSSFRVGETVIAAADVVPGRYEKSAGFSILLNMDDVAAAERMFAALSENARVDMPLQETFWAKRFGSLVDQFGIPWSINCE
jgi:PhnB protein